MKTKFHIPTAEYEFVEVELELDSEDGSVAEHLRELKQLLNHGQGLPKEEWNQALDKFLQDGTGDMEQWQRMNEFQQGVLQEIKKSNKRK